MLAADQQLVVPRASACPAGGRGGQGVPGPGCIRCVAAHRTEALPEREAG